MGVSRLIIHVINLQRWQGVKIPVLVWRKEWGFEFINSSKNMFLLMGGEGNITPRFNAVPNLCLSISLMSQA